MVKHNMILSLVLLALAMATFTIKEGVDGWAQTSVTCLVGGCVALSAGNQGGWAGLVFSGLSALVAGGYQGGLFKKGTRDLLHSSDSRGLEARAIYDGFIGNMTNLGYESSHVEALYTALFTGQTATLTHGDHTFAIRRPRDRSIHIKSVNDGSKRGNGQYELFIDERVDGIYLPDYAVQEWADNIASGIMATNGDVAGCVTIEQASEEGGYAYAAVQYDADSDLSYGCAASE